MKRSICLNQASWASKTPNLSKMASASLVVLLSQTLLNTFLRRPTRPRWRELVHGVHRQSDCVPEKPCLHDPAAEEQGETRRPF